MNSMSFIWLFTAFPAKKMRRNVSNPDNDMFLKVIEMHPEILQGILSTIINIVMFEDCKNQWSLSRPLLGLILLYEDYFRYNFHFIQLFTFKIPDAELYLQIFSYFEFTDRWRKTSFDLNRWISNKQLRIGLIISWKMLNAIYRWKTVISKSNVNFDCSSWQCQFIQLIHCHCFLLYRFSQNLSLFRRDVNETLKQANLNAANSTAGSGGGSIGMNDMIVS